jgi:hypothetical protein
LWVVSDAPAEGFYRKVGFVDTGERVPGGPVFSVYRVQLQSRRVEPRWGERAIVYEKAKPAASRTTGSPQAPVWTLTAIAYPVALPIQMGSN